MAYSLRKRLSRRHGKEDLKTDNADEHSTTSDTISPTQEVANTTPRKSAAEDLPANDELGNTPPPPQPTIRRVSPSQISLERYKLRAPSFTAPVTAPSKTTAFREDFDVSRKSLPPDLPSAPASERQGSVTVRDARFDSLSSSDSEAARASECADMGQATSAMESLIVSGEGPRPPSNAQARLKTRTDSAASGLPLARKRSDPVPAGLTIRKKVKTAFPRTPSPRTSSPAQSPCRSGNTPTSTTSPSLLPNPTCADTASIDRALSPSDPNAICVSPKASPLDDETGSSEIWGSGKVLVSPPCYIPDVNKILLWCDSRASTSRPIEVFGESKRWTCCRCRALTIVEQRECAKLKCGHSRCASSCKVKWGGSKELLDFA